MKCKYFLIVSLFPLFCQGQVVKGFKQVTNGIKVTLSDGTLSICPLTENAVRVKFYREPEVQMPELVFTSKVPVPQFRVSDSPSKIEIKGKNIIVTVDKQTGKLSFANPSGKIFLNEKEGSRKIVPDSVNGVPCCVAEQRFESPTDSA